MDPQPATHLMLERPDHLRRRPFAEAEIERTEDLDVFVDRLISAFYPAHVNPLDPRLEPVSEITALRMTHLTLGFVRPGHDVNVDPGVLGSYHVNVALSGRVKSTCGHRSAIATPTTATVFRPDQPTRLPHWEAGATQLCIKIRRQAMEREAARLIGRPLERTIDFELGLDLRNPRGASWLATLELLLSELRCPQGLAGSSVLYREQLESLVISGLVIAQHSSLFDELHGATRPLRPRTVERVLELIENDPSQPFTLGVLAEHAGVSARRLQQSFGEHVGKTPMTYLREARLQRAHRELRETDDPIGVIALRWGFMNTGRFAATYRAEYGRSPSEVRSG
jgi:AraC-like DNA-binding protein